MNAQDVEFFTTEDGSIGGGMKMPEVLYEKLSLSELAELREFVYNRFAMGYWYAEQQGR